MKNRITQKRRIVKKLTKNEILERHTKANEIRQNMIARHGEDYMTMIDEMMDDIIPSVNQEKC